MPSADVAANERTGAVGRWKALAACVCAILLLPAVASHAAARLLAGRLDSAFGRNGRSITTPGTAGGEADVRVETPLT
jgi:hypothetical protein